VKQVRFCKSRVTIESIAFVFVSTLFTPRNVTFGSQFVQPQFFCSEPNRFSGVRLSAVRTSVHSRRQSAECAITSTIWEESRRGGEGEQLDQANQRHWSQLERSAPGHRRSTVFGLFFAFCPLGPCNIGPVFAPLSAVRPLAGARWPKWQSALSIADGSARPKQSLVEVNQSPRCSETRPNDQPQITLHVAFLSNRAISCNYYFIKTNITVKFANHKKRTWNAICCCIWSCINWCHSPTKRHYLL